MIAVIQCSSIAIGISWYSLSRNIELELMRNKYKWLTAMVLFLFTVEIFMSVLKLMFFPIGLFGAISGGLSVINIVAVEIWFGTQAVA
ncbi:hypothetical protein HK096_007235, partial [Nowakowskiella sp. JEL0078]